MGYFYLGKYHERSRVWMLVLKRPWCIVMSSMRELVHYTVDSLINSHLLAILLLFHQSRFINYRTNWLALGLEYKQANCSIDIIIIVCLCS